MNAAATEAWWRLTEALRSVDGDTGFDDLRDVLWLAQKLPKPQAAPRTGAAKQTSTAPGQAVLGAASGLLSTSFGKPPAKSSAPPGMRSVPVDDPDPLQAAVYAGSSTGGGIAARRIRLPAPHPLPDALAIARALQPVTRRRAQGPAVLLDEEATAEAIAHSELVTPVLRQRRERWFTLLLAVDDGPAMLAWRARIDAFEHVLRRAGFRDVRRVALHGSGPGPAVLRTGSGALVSPQAQAGGAGTANSLLLVVSDAAGAAWHDGRVSALLSPWTKLLPMALVQPLPPALWPHTATGFAELQVAAAVPGQVAERLHERRPDWAYGEPGLVLPVLALQAPDVASWARMVMAAGNAWCRAALLPPADDGTAPAAADAAAADAPARLLAAFRAASTPDALELAAAFAVIRPLNVPVMRLIQAVMLPQAGTDALAQVLMSGLLRRVGDDTPDAGAAASLRDEDIGYEIDDPVRDALANHLTRSRWLEVNLAVQRFVEIETGVGFDFIAFIEDRLGLEQVAPSALPFAQLAARMAERFVPGRAGGRRRQRFVDEEVLGKGMTVQARRELPSPAKRIEWAPSGTQLAVLHRWGVEVLARDGLTRRQRVRHEANVLAWVVWPGDEPLLEPLMDRVRDQFELLGGFPLTNRLEHFKPATALFEEVPAAIRLIALTPGWPSAVRNLGEIQTYRYLKYMHQSSGWPLVPTTSTAGLALEIRFDPLLDRWPGVLDRPVASAETGRAIADLWKLLKKQRIVPETDTATDGLVDAVGWSPDDDTDRLVTVRRNIQAALDGMQVFVDSEAADPLPAPNNARLVDFAPATRKLRWDAAGVIGAYWAERFSPDGGCLARIDHQGVLSLSEAVSGEST